MLSVTLLAVTTSARSVASKFAPPRLGALPESAHGAVLSIAPRTEQPQLPCLPVLDVAAHPLDHVHAPRLPVPAVRVVEFQVTFAAALEALAAHKLAQRLCHLCALVLPPVPFHLVIALAPLGDIAPEWEVQIADLVAYQL